MSIQLHHHISAEVANRGVQINRRGVSVEKCLKKHSNDRSKRS